jgi:hypothetical protein
LGTWAQVAREARKVNPSAAKGTIKVRREICGRFITRIIRQPTLRKHEGGQGLQNERAQWVNRQQGPQKWETLNGWSDKKNFNRESTRIDANKEEDEEEIGFLIRVNLRLPAIAKSDGGCIRG